MPPPWYFILVRHFAAHLHAQTLKTVYSELPNYDRILPVLLAEGFVRTLAGGIRAERSFAA